MFPRDSSGRSFLFPIKEESTGLATSCPVSKKANGKEPPRVELLLPPTRAPLLKAPTGSAGPASSSRTLTDVFQASSVPVEQEEEPTLRDGPVVTPRPPVRSSGRYSCKSTEESQLLSSRNTLEPPASSGAVRAASSDFLPKSEGDTRRETVGSDSHRAAEAWCSRTGTLQAQIINTDSDGLAPSAFDPSLEYSTEQVMLFWQPPSYFSQRSPSSFVVHGVSYC